MDTKKRKQVTCSDNGKCPLAGAHARKPASMKQEKCVRAGLSLLTINTIPGVK